MGLNLLLVGPDDTNSTDGFIVEGVRRLLADAFPGYEEKYFYLDDHNKTHRQELPWRGQKFDAIVVCGTPWIWDRFYLSHKYKNLRRIQKYHKCPTIFMGVGTCFTLPNMDTAICEDAVSQKALRTMYTNSLVFTRERVAQSKLEKAGVVSTWLPCPGFYSVEERPGEPEGGPMLCWADPASTISGDYWKANPDRLSYLVSEIEERVTTYDNELTHAVYQAKAGEVSHFPNTKVCETWQEAAEIISRHSDILTMRVHWAVPAIAMGHYVKVIPLDTRYLTTHVNVTTLEDDRFIYVTLLMEYMNYEHTSPVAQKTRSRSLRG